LKVWQHKHNIRASLGDVFLAITSSETMEKWMGERAIMNARVNGHFVWWNGKIVGVNRYISLRTIVQDWKLKDWKAYSSVTYNLFEMNGVTELEVVHEAIPDKDFNTVKKVWEKEILKPLSKYLESN